MDDNITHITDARNNRGRPEDALRLALTKPVSMNFLADVFGVDRRKVKTRLRKVQPIEINGRISLYDIAEAAKAIFTEQQSGPLTEDSLTPGQQKALWSSRKDKVAVYRETGLLWHSEQISHAFDEVFKTFRDQTLALPEKVKNAERAGNTLVDVAYEILEATRTQIEKEIRALSIKSFSDGFSQVSDEELEDLEFADDDGEDA